MLETKGMRSPERQFNYKQINESSNQLAHYLLSNGCERGDVVMIYAYRGSVHSANLPNICGEDVR